MKKPPAKSSKAKKKKGAKARGTAKIPASSPVREVAETLDKDKKLGDGKTNRKEQRQTRSNAEQVKPPQAQQDESQSDDQSPFSAIYNPKKRAFLVAFVETGGIRRTSALSKVEWRNHYNWLEADEAYRTAFDKARQLAGDFAEDEIYRRAFLGFDHPVVYEGRITTTYKEFSDNLAMFYLKGLKPERYRENVNLSGNVGVSVDDFYNKIAERSAKA